MARHEKKALLKREITAADRWADATRTRCAKAIVEWLKGSLNTQRPINTLKLAELECMAEAATSTWIVEASKRIDTEPKEDTKDLRLLLLA